MRELTGLVLIVGGFLVALYGLYQLHPALLPVALGAGAAALGWSLSVTKENQRV